MPISFTHLTAPLHAAPRFARTLLAAPLFAAPLLAALLLAGCGGAGDGAAPADAGASASPASASASASTAAAPASAAPGTAAASGAGGPGEWFVSTGCVQCHSVSVYGVKAKGEIGPDLSIASDDVKSRFGVTLEEFFDAPSGTMAIVLSTQIQLTPDQKKVAIAKLHEAYAAYQKQQAATR